jgi:hypothetical protein
MNNKERMRERRKNQEVRERDRVNSRRYWEIHKDSIKAQRKARRDLIKNDPIKSKEYKIQQKQSRDRYKLEKKARNAARYTPITSAYCELCPEDDKLPATQKHHPDYNYPAIFVSCCTKCHVYADNRILNCDIP